MTPPPPPPAKNSSPIPPASLVKITRQFLDVSPQRRALWHLDDGESELARQVVKLGIIALFEAARRDEREGEFDRSVYESLYVQLADRFGEARQAIRALDKVEAETFRLIFLDQAARAMHAGRFSLGMAAAKRAAPEPNSRPP